MITRLLLGAGLAYIIDKCLNALETTKGHDNESVSSSDGSDVLDDRGNEPGPDVELGSGESVTILPDIDKGNLETDNQNDQSTSNP